MFRSGPGIGGAARAGVIYDVLYGFVPITEWEGRIIDSPFFQRLRWIKQLSFANYIFPGAEHTRFAHVIGVMHSMDQMVRALGMGVSEEELFDPKSRSQEALLHKSLRVAALLHDIGTFPFSHAVERAYVKLGAARKGARPRGAKELPENHEHLGSFIIKNTDFEGGITRILRDASLDTHLISRIIKGDSPFLIANQLMHSDLDADRMDYLIRDSHYTGIKYGQFDRDYVLANLVTFDAGGGQRALGVSESALHAVEDFLIARFSWYSQIIRNRDSAKFDVICAKLAEVFLEAGLLHGFHDLLSMIESGDERFYWWNDVYFINQCREAKATGAIRDAKARELIEMLLYRRPPRTIHHPALEPRLLDGDEVDRAIARARKTVEQLEREIERHGSGREWILADIPDAGLRFTQPLQRIVKARKHENLYRERDPLKVVSKSGKPSLLVELESSLMRLLAGQANFIPCVYGSEAAIALLEERGALAR